MAERLLDPHAEQPVSHFGSPVDEANGVVVLLHGRGSSAADILSLGAALQLPELAFLAPQAADHTWYPNSFMAPRASNEPYVASALARVERIVAELETQGIGRERIAIAGFSQGACLTSEFAGTYPARYGALIAFTGGLIGEQGVDLRHAGNLAGTPALLLSGDPDPHVPWSRVVETATELERMGSVVTAQRYPGRPHTVSREELGLARALLIDSFGLGA